VNCRFTLILSQHFQHWECFTLIRLSKFQLNVDHTATYDIVSLAVFQFVRNDFANSVFDSAFLEFFNFS